MLCLVTQLYPSLCNPMDFIPPSSMSMGILQARILRGLPSSGDLPNPGDLPPPGDLPNPGMEARSSTLQADSLPSEPPGKP